MNRVPRTFTVVAFLGFLLACTNVSTASAANLTCSSATTLDALATCIRLQMPQSGSNGYVAPTATEQADWRTVVGQMLQGQCDFTLPASLAGIMQIRTFNDNSNGRGYCLLMEVLDANNNGFVDRGWGTFVVYNDATLELHHHSPHPISDSTTENQGIGIFRDTDSRAYLMSGAHRLANSGSSSCQSLYGPADAAHNVANMFQPTNQELMAFYGSSDFWVIQWHGMAADTCDAAQVYLSHGRDVAPLTTDKSYQLKANMLNYHPTWDIELTGTGACTLNATDNTQGRLLNGVAAANVCNTAASSYSGRFLHIEQDPGFRTPADWAQAVIDTWSGAPPPPPQPPAAPTNLTATAGKKKITVAWTASAGATSYRVKRSITSGGPYTVVATVSGTTYQNNGLASGTTYYYVVSAVNAVGEGPNSAQVSGTAK